MAHKTTFQDKLKGQLLSSVNKGSWNKAAQAFFVSGFKQK